MSFKLKTVKEVSVLDGGLTFDERGKLKIEDETIKQLYRDHYDSLMKHGLSPQEILEKKPEYTVKIKERKEEATISLRTE